MAKRSRNMRKREVGRVCRPTQWLICCEGATEATYLSALVKELSEKSGKINHGIHIGLNDKRCSRKGVAGACQRQHNELLKKAETCSSSFAFEKVWIVFDLDADGQQNKEEIHNKFAEAIRRADERIQVAWSIPCFEYWMLLHKKNLTATTQKAIEDDIKRIMTDARDSKLSCRKEFASTATDHCNKDKTILCEECLNKPYCNSLVCLGGLAGVEKARKNSRHCYAENEENIKKQKFKQISCCSNMHTLVEALMEYFEIETLEN